MVSLAGLGSRSLTKLFAPVPAIVDTLRGAGYTGIGPGPTELHPPTAINPYTGVQENYELNVVPGGDVSFSYTPETPDKPSLLKGLGYFFKTFFATSPAGIGANIATTALEGATANDTIVLSAPAVTRLTNQGGTMAFQDGDSGFFGGLGDIWGGINNVLQANGQNLLNLGFNAANSFVQSQFAPQPVSYGGGGMAQPTMAAVPAVIGAGRAVATVGRGFFTRFPNLATAIQSLRNRGSNVTRGSLYSAMRRFGPEMLVTGGIMSAAAVSELAVAGPGRRRMNPGNVKALRRAHRRMKSFHKVCVDNDQLIRRRRK